MGCRDRIPCQPSNALTLLKSVTCPKLASVTGSADFTRYTTVLKLCNELARKKCPEETTS